MRFEESVTVVSARQLINAPSPSIVTLFGSEIDVRAVQEPNAL